MVRVKRVVIVFLVCILLVGCSKEHKEIVDVGDVPVPDRESSKLDDGTRKATRKLSYSYYTTFDGECVTVIMNGFDDKSKVAVECGGAVSDWVDAARAVSIPIELELVKEDVVDATLLVDSGGRKDKYPLVVEMLADTVVKETLAHGDEYGRYIAEQSVLERNKNESPNSYSKLGSLNIESIVTDEDVRVDFENFNVITIKGR